jgi:hypothetical protein
MDPIARSTIARQPRNDKYWIPAMKAMIFKDDNFDNSCKSGNRRFCNWLHILNNYPSNLREMAMKHWGIKERYEEVFESGCLKGGWKCQSSPAMRVT